MTLQAESEAEKARLKVEREADRERQRVDREAERARKAAEADKRKQEDELKARGFQSHKSLQKAQNTLKVMTTVSTMFVCEVYFKQSSFASAVASICISGDAMVTAYLNACCMHKPGAVVAPPDIAPPERVCINHMLKPAHRSVSAPVVPTELLQQGSCCESCSWLWWQ